MLFLIYLLFLYFFFYINKKNHRSGSTLKWSRNPPFRILFRVSRPGSNPQWGSSGIPYWIFQDRQDPGYQKRWNFSVGVVCCLWSHWREVSTKRNHILLALCWHLGIYILSTNDPWPMTMPLGTYVYIHIYIPVQYIYMYMYMYMCICICIYIYICICICICICMYYYMITWLYTHNSMLVISFIFITSHPIPARTQV